MSRLFTILKTGAALSVLLATPSVAADFKSSDDFAGQATIGNMFEIKTSQLALERSQNPDIRAFAEKIIADHTKAGADLKAALASSKIDTKVLPTKLDDKHQRVYDELVNTPADKFDTAYVDVQDDAHEETIALFKSYTNTGDSTSLKQFAQNTLPTLKVHAQHVDKLDDKIDD